MGRVGTALALVALALCCSAGAARAEQVQQQTQQKQANEDFSKALSAALLFYEAQQSGKLQQWNRVRAGSPGGWRRDAHLDDGKAIGTDLSGGYYDAGDYLKCAHPLAWALSNLALSGLEFRDAYEAAGSWGALLSNARAMADWLAKGHVVASDDPSKNVFVGQVGSEADHWFYGRPEHASAAVPRPVYTASAARPGADLAAEYAAAFAAAACLFRAAGDAPYASGLFKRARQAYAFAARYPKNWQLPDGTFQAYKSYWPSAYIGHLAFASAWMCKYDPSSCPDAAGRWADAARVNELRWGLGYDWDSVLPGAAAVWVTMGAAQPAAAAAAAEVLEGYVLARWEDRSRKCGLVPPPTNSAVCYTPKGLARFSETATLRSAADVAFLATIMARRTAAPYAADNHACFAQGQGRYIIGASTGRSFVVGFGPDPPLRPHHRAAACAPLAAADAALAPARAGNGTCSPGEGAPGGSPCCDFENFASVRPSPVVLKGAMVGGPDHLDRYQDARNDYRFSEVALDANAGFTGLMAGLASLAGKLARCDGDGRVIYVA